MRIPCPFCGERDSSEFTYLGEAKERPDPAQPEAPARFLEYVYLRSDPAGPHEELWYHEQGCRWWLCVRRNTRTHEILAVRLTKREVASS
jgi:methylglutamate dehydrogenase subunit B